ncbi:MAG TPA: glycosyltransferase family 2 protein [Anaerolineales bacterium]|jgi:undecaprenyl-phosphate 4-deoxy-4-formamido-L-arabinose transferase|nr:glycosyltransferase family 2 protein [Anaerolineales bacterium]HMN00082.1 glycosyltransferase family 2 protein [Anaerolineales bacterium]
MSIISPSDPASNRIKHNDGNVSLSVVVPVYNSEGSLRELVARLNLVLPELTDQFELLLINDGSRDRSWEVVEELARVHPWITGINFMRNFGQHNALLCGIREARFEIIVTLDDDCQNPPEEIPKLIEKINAGFDVVYGSPRQTRHGLWRDLASQITKIALQSVMGADTARKVSAFRAFRTPLRQAFATYGGSFVNIDVLLSWASTRFSSVDVLHRPRESGRSNYTFRALVVHALNMITGFSMLPLQIASLVGFLFTVFGIMVLFYVIARYLIQGGSIPGFPFLASTIAIFSGAQLFSLGIIGEYLARMHFRLMDRPTYVIQKVYKNAAGEEA